MSILKFSSEGCGPCYALGVMLDDLMVDYDEIDIGKNMELAIEHRVRSVPVLINTSNNNRMDGFTDKETVEAWLNDNQS